MSTQTHDAAAEPTLYDVIDAMNAGFTRVEERFEHIDKRFEHIEERFEHIDARFEQMDQRFDRMDRRFDDMDARFEELKHEQRLLSRRQFAVDLKDEDRADTVMNHEERLVRLELWRKGFGKKGLAVA